jgi:arylsulfatase A-like enzyme
MNERMKINKILGCLVLVAFMQIEIYAQKVKPNVLFILVDDLGWQDLGSYGSEFYETPNIDQLRSEGMMFTNAYSASPICSPTRASILTGKNPTTLHFTGHITSIEKHRHPIDSQIIPPDDNMFVPLNEVMIPEALLNMGYATASIGKWHVGIEEKHFPTHQGFDINIAGYEHGSPPTYWGPYEKESDWNPVIKNLCDREEGEYLTNRLTDEGIKFIQDHKERPFFLYLSHYGVHTPLEAPPKLVEKYEKKLKDNPVQKNATYAAMVENMDSNIGRLLNSLKELGLSKNTIVIFYSDNGGEGRVTNNSPLREGKGYLYEGGIRVPLIIKWPGKIPENSTSNVPVISDDLYPTIMALIGKGTQPGKDLDGVSLKPILTKGKGINRNELHWYYPHYSPQAKMPSYAIRKGDFKLIESYDPIALELYNLKEDIGENKNLALDYPAKVLELQNHFAKWLEESKPVYHTLNTNRKKL